MLKGSKYSEICDVWLFLSGYGDCSDSGSHQHYHALCYSFAVLLRQAVYHIGIKDNKTMPNNVSSAHMMEQLIRQCFSCMSGYVCMTVLF